MVVKVFEGFKKMKMNAVMEKRDRERREEKTDEKKEEIESKMVSWGRKRDTGDY